MEFYAVANQKRPVRLSRETREFAWESLMGKYGDEAMETPSVSLDHIAGFDNLSPLKQYDIAISEIAEKAPIRICKNEKISGAATLGDAILHRVPASRNGKTLWPSVSHLTLGFDKVLRIGINGIEKEIEEHLKNNNVPDCQREFYESLKNTISSLRLWHARYLDALKEMNSPNYTVLKNVPFEPPGSFHEAVQSLWFAFAFTRLTGNWSGIGRIDQMLGGYLKSDLDSKLITIDEAREILAHFFIKGCEWIRSAPPRESGDAQHYQNIILSGIDENGNDVTNDVTWLVLDIIEELGISDFPVSVRVNRNTPDKLLNRISEVIKFGGGIIAIYNEELVIQSMIDFGYSLEEARRFANDGCWEVQVPGKTYFTYIPFDGLKVLLNTLGIDSTTFGGTGGLRNEYKSMDELYQAFRENLKATVESIYSITVKSRLQFNDRQWKWKTNIPCTVVSLFTEGCIQNGRSYLEGGPVYNVISPHIGGVADIANSLYAIQKLVFDDKLISLNELTGILERNWENNEVLRQIALNKYEYYGNDNDEVDEYAARILDDFADMVEELNGRCPISFPPGVSTFGRQIEWAKYRSAVPFGRKKGEILSGNSSPSPGTDYRGATAIIKSYCKANLARLTCGSALDIVLHPSSVAGENGTVAITSLVKGFISLGGFFMQMDIANTDVFRKAQENPEQYRTLSVRVSGWNARFVTLDRDWQQMIIERAEQGI